MGACRLGVTVWLGLRLAVIVGDMLGVGDMLPVRLGLPVNDSVEERLPLLLGETRDENVEEKETETEPEIEIDTDEAKALGLDVGTKLAIETSVARRTVVVTQETGTLQCTQERFVDNVRLCGFLSRMLSLLSAGRDMSSICVDGSMCWDIKQRRHLVVKGSRVYRRICEKGLWHEYNSTGTRGAFYYSRSR